MTEILESAGIHIDNFKISVKPNLFLLTHAHADHCPGNVKKFKYPIYCSFLTSTLIENENIYILESNSWYEINHISFYVFETIHCPGSIGFYFPKQKLLHLGDTRVTTELLKKIKELGPKNILYDNTHEKFKGMFPSLETSAIMLQQVVTERLENTKKTVNLCIPHIGAILLLSMLNLKVRTDESLKIPVLNLLKTMSLIDQKSRVVAVGMKNKKINIMPSSQFFVIKKLNPHKVVHVGKNLTRVFASFHAGDAETHLLSAYNLISLNYNSN